MGDGLRSSESVPPVPTGGNRGTTPPWVGVGIRPLMRAEPLGVGVIAASVVGGFGAAYLLQYLYDKRANPGAFWFGGNIAAVTVFCFAYGLSLLVSDPTVRRVAEAVSFVCVAFMGPFFLAFGLAYTGRTDLVRSPLFGVVGAVPVVTTVLAATNPIHGLVWTGFRFDPVLGLATVRYTVEPWGLFALLFSIGTAAVGSLLLIGAILSYGPLYRREASAVTLSTIPPTVGVSVWLAGVGPVPALHLTAPLMVVHVALDAYAFVGTHMFETSPATQRVAEQTGLDTLAEPVLVLDDRENVVKFNDTAEQVFERSSTTGRPVPLEAVVGVDLSTLRETGEVEVGGTDGGTFAVSYTPLSDPSRNPVGGMVVLYDLQEERQRKQQLSVLNRVLRHNLRNEITVVNGYAETLERSLEDPELRQQAATISRAGNRLLTIGEKIREFDRIQDEVRYPEPVDLDTMVSAVRKQLRQRFPNATIETEIEVPGGEIHTQPAVLKLALVNLIENALKHTEATEPTVRVYAEAGGPEGEKAAIGVVDTNPEVPTEEIAVLDTASETPLQHGQGIGLWIVNWCVTELNGDLDHRYDGGNRFVITLPPG